MKTRHVPQIKPMSNHPEFPLEDARHPSDPPKTYEVRVQLLNETPAPGKVETPEQAFDYWRNTIRKMPWYFSDREILVCLMLNTRLRVTGHSLVSVGSLNESIAQPREIFRAACVMNAYAIVAMHSHPSGDPSPSEADRRLTRRIAEAGTLLQIALLDHVIVGETFFSFKQAGML